MANPLHLLLAGLPVLVAPGCCSLASLFCGPDRSPWVPISFETPRAAVRTFLEAVRRANADVIYLSLAPEYRRELALGGALEANLVWDRVQEQNPYIHVAGTADVPDQPTHRADRGASYELEVRGYRFRIDLVQLPYWVLKAENSRQELLATGDYLESLHGTVELAPDAASTGTEVRLRLHAEDLAVDRLEDVVLAGAGREWKVRRITRIDEEEG